MNQGRGKQALYGVIGVAVLAVMLLLLWNQDNPDSALAPTVVPKTIAASLSRGASQAQLPVSGPVATSPASFRADLSFDPALLKRLRRQWNGRAPVPDPALPETNQLVLMNRVISTRVPARDYAGPFTARGTAPFLIQFPDSIEESWQAGVRAAGATMINYIPKNGWLVEMTPAVRQAVAALPMVQWVGALEAGDKIQPFLKRIESAFSGDFRRINVAVLCLQAADLPVVSQWLKAQDMPVRSAEETSVGAIVRARLTPDLVSALARLPEVQWVEEEVPRELHNDQAVIASHMNVTSVWNSYFLTGKGQIVGHADTGLDIGTTNGIHPDFAGRVLAAFALGRANTWSDVDSHGTHTAGSILGNGAMSSGQYRGVAWEAQLVHQSVEDAGGTFTGIPNDLSELFLPPYNLGARVHSDSWGGAGYGQYEDTARSADMFMWNNPSMLLVFSAGNEGYDSNVVNGVVELDSMSSPGTAKNVLTVGAMESDRPSSSYGYTWRKWGYSAWPADYPADPIYSDLISWSTNSPYRQGMAAFSSRGPTDDGRVKPDVVASGTDVISCRSRAAPSNKYGWGVAANTNYIYDGGTSMSCPLTAGAVLLIRQYLVERAGVTNPSAALMKAMIISGARTMAPGQYGTNAFQEIPFTSPNMVEGFGQVDVGQSVYPTGMSIRLVDRAGLANKQTSNTVFTIEAAGSPLSVALVWTDYPGSAQGGGPKLINDYDLTLTTPDGQTLYPNGGVAADHLNPVEVIRVAHATNGVYTAKVTGTNVVYSSCRYALVLRGAINQPPELFHTPPTPVLLTTNACPLSALLTYYTPLTNGQFRIFWSTNGVSGPFTLSAMGWQDGHNYTGAIPAQSLGTVVSYYLSATVSTHSVLYPTNAPAALQQVVFSNPLVSLEIAGTRTNSVVVSPAYGFSSYPSGTLVHATAQALCTSGTTWRFLCDGWRATGASPASSATATADITLLGPAVLTWLWGEEALFTQNSSPTGAVDVVSWQRTNTVVSTVTAWDFAWDTSASPAIPYALAGWKIDGVLWTNSLRQAANPATNIVMKSPHTATAWYLTYTNDANANNLQDWWEYRYSGNTGVVTSASDPDGDGWNNGSENDDNTDPWNSNSYPLPPVIEVTPLPTLQTASPPWRISAVITDNFTVAEAVVFWTVNGGAIQTTPMTTAGDGVYTADIDPGRHSAVSVAYQVGAADLVFAAYSDVYQTDSEYPILRVSPTNYNTIRLPREGYQQPALVANDGTQPLTWEMFPLTPVLDDAMEGGTAGWLVEGGGWHLSTYRTASPSNAWYCGSDSTRQYATGLMASLISPPVALGGGSLLTFKHWMRAEASTDGYYWDGGVVRISLDDGATFQDLTPIGGYPFRIEPNVDSPFEPSTPCFGNNDWIETRVDLSSYSGTVARIAFFFGADYYTEAEGWYIDDVWVGASLTGSWLSATGAVSAVYPAGQEEHPFVLKADSGPLAPQANLRGALRFNHDGVGGGLDLVPFRFRRPAYITATAGAQGQVIPEQADVLDGEATSVMARAASGSRIVSILTNGVAVPGTFGFGSTSFVLTVQGLMSDLMVTARFARVWSVTVSAQGAGTAAPAGVIPMDEGTSTSVMFQAENGAEIWNLVVNGQGRPEAGGLAQFDWPVSAISTHQTAVAAFGTNVLTGLPAPVSAAYMREYYPDSVDYDSLAMQDTDGDGMETWKESVAGTSPTNASSVLRLSELPDVVSGNPMSVALRFESVPGKSYQAEMADSPGGPWTPAGAVISATGAVGQVQFGVSGTSPRAFFRISVLP